MCIFMYDNSMGYWRARSKFHEKLNVTIRAPAESLLLGQYTWEVIGDNKQCDGTYFDLTFR